MNPIKASGQEFKTFLAEMKTLHGSIYISKESGFYIEIEVDGIIPSQDVDLGLIDDTAKVSVCGYVQVGGVGEFWKLQGLYRKWQKGLMTVTCTARIPREKFSEFCEAVKGMGGAVVLN